LNGYWHAQLIFAQASCLPCNIQIAHELKGVAEQSVKAALGLDAMKSQLSPRAVDAPRRGTSPNSQSSRKHDHTSLRARCKGDIEAIFGSNTEVLRTPARDYLFRARERVASVIAAMVRGIDYDNFKETVGDDNGRGQWYARVWVTMASLQESFAVEKAATRRID